MLTYSTVSPTEQRLLGCIRLEHYQGQNKHLLSYSSSLIFLLYDKFLRYRFKSQPGKTSNFRISISSSMRQCIWSRIVNLHIYIYLILLHIYGAYTTVEFLYAYI